MAERSRPQLEQYKARVLSLLAGVDGITGVGIGADEVVVMVRDDAVVPAVANVLPLDIPYSVTVTGTIRATVEEDKRG